MWNGAWGSQPEVAPTPGTALSMTSAEANEIDWGAVRFDVGKMNDDVARGASALSNIGPDVLVYACTSGTWHKGYLEYDRMMAKIMEDASGIPSVTAVGSCIAALRHVGSRKLSIAGPYRNFHLRNRLKPLMEEAGFQVLSADGEPWDAGFHEPPRNRPGPAPSHHRLRPHGGPGRGPIPSSCPAPPGAPWDAAEELEQKLGKTVITVNQASIWMALRRLGWEEADRRLRQPAAKLGVTTT